MQPLNGYQGWPAALEKIKDDTGCWNKSLATLRLEQEAARRPASPQRPQTKKNGLDAEASNPLIRFLLFWRGWQDSNPRPLGS